MLKVKRKSLIRGPDDGRQSIEDHALERFALAKGLLGGEPIGQVDPCRQRPRDLPVGAEHADIPVDHPGFVPGGDQVEQKAGRQRSALSG